MKLLDPFNKPLIIAELGGKFGDMDIVERSIRAAVEAGADMIKFQTYCAETIATPGATFEFEDGSVVSQHEWFSKTELTFEDHQRIDGLCQTLGVPWISTPSHPEDVELLEKFDCPAYKTGSDDLTNLPFLRYIAQKGRPMIVSTGMCTLAEVTAAVETIFSAGNEQLILLHCVSNYPSRPEDANLKAMDTLRAAFGVPVGLSDHTTDELTSVIATTMGAEVIEKHFTLDHALDLPDHQVSLDPAAWRTLVDRVRMVPRTLGDGRKRILEPEKVWRKNARKSLFAARSIAEGETVTEDHLAVRRPGEGIHPHHYELVLGRTAKTSIDAGTLLSWAMV